MMLWDVRTRHPMTVACRYYYPTSESAAYLDNETGKIFYKSETSDINEIDEEDADGEQMMEIAHKNDLDLGQALVFGFVASHLPDEYDRVRDIFRRSKMSFRSIATKSLKKPIFPFLILRTSCQGEANRTSNLVDYSLLPFSCRESKILENIGLAY